MGERDDLRIRLAEMLAKNEEVLTLANVCIHEVAATRTEHTFSVGALTDKGATPFPHPVAQTPATTASSAPSHTAGNATTSDPEDIKSSEEERSPEAKSSESDTSSSATSTPNITPATSLDEDLGVLAPDGNDPASFESHVERTERIKKRLTLLLEESKDLEQLFQEYDENIDIPDDKKMVSKKDVRRMKRDMQRELRDRKKVTTILFCLACV